MANNFYRRIFMLATFVFISGVLQSQTITDSPYSRYGIGEVNTMAFVPQYAMGGTGIALRSPFMINVLNPASYSSMKLTTFDVGMSTKNVFFSADTQQLYTNKTYMNHMALGTPITKWWGMAFGLMPFSGMGYNYTLNDSLAYIGHVDYYYKGNGGINKAFVGNSILLKADSLNHFSVGFNVSYLFGELFQERKMVFKDVSNVFNTWVIESNAAADFNFDFGIQYIHLLKDNKRIIIGATFAHQQNITSSLNKAAITFSGNPGFEKKKDTLYFDVGIANKLQTPQSAGFAAMFENTDKFNITGEAQKQFWSKTIFNNTGNIADSYRAAIGLQWIPNVNSSNYTKTIRYRMGTRYTSTYWNLQNTTLTEYGITFGFGMPIRVPKSQGVITFPFVNAGIELGQRGTTQNKLIKENFINIYLSLSVSDKWFIKRKYD